MTEQELAEIIVWWLNEFKWTVYQEVQWERYGATIDIVATRGPLLRVVECKMSFTSAVIEQAWRHRHYAHLVHIATPVTWRTTKGRTILVKAMQHLGIGHLEANSHDDYDFRLHESKGVVREVHERYRSRFERRAAAHLIRAKLCEEQKTFAPAGNANGLRFTPWKATCKRWAEYVALHPGCTLKEIVAEAEHHYLSDASAKISMARWIQDGHVKGIQIERDGRLIRLYPVEEKTE